MHNACKYIPSLQISCPPSTAHVSKIRRANISLLDWGLQVGWQTKFESTSTHVHNYTLILNIGWRLPIQNRIQDFNSHACVKRCLSTNLQTCVHEPRFAGWWTNKNLNLLPHMRTITRWFWTLGDICPYRTGFNSHACVIDVCQPTYKPQYSVKRFSLSTFKLGMRYVWRSRWARVCQTFKFGGLCCAWCTYDTERSNSTDSYYSYSVP